jgi:nucleoside-diphosphate-sugar epimerase
VNVLVVGGSGYIGGIVTDLLLESPHTTRVYDCLLYEEAYRKPGDFVYGDIRDHDLLSRHLDWADAVVWLAALVGDGACALNTEIAVELNQRSVSWLAENFDGRIVFLSTCSVYGAQDAVLDETSSTGPLSVYAATKLAAEQYLADRNALIFRLGTIYGVGDLFSRIRLDLVVNAMTVRAVREGEITVFGGDQFRPLLHVRDVARAIVQNVDAAYTGIFNLHRDNVKILDLATTMQRHFPDLVVNTTEMTFEDARNYRVTSEKARSLLGFEPKFAVDDGIEEVRTLIESERLKDVNDVRYTNEGFLSANSHHLHYASPRE